MQASFAAKGDWQGLMKYNPKGSKPTHQQGQTASRPRRQGAPPDDLTQLSGIGPRISTILADGGVTTYEQLEHTDPSELRTVIAAEWRAAAVEPRLVADPGVVRDAGRLVGPRDLQQPQVGSAGTTVLDPDHGHTSRPSRTSGGSLSWLGERWRFLDVLVRGLGLAADVHREAYRAPHRTSDPDRTLVDSPDRSTYC